jgi:tRNA(adenine34) deaminase
MLEYNDEYFMRQALREARVAFDKEEVPVGAIVVLDNKIISRGHNQVELLNDSTAHAEILALTAAYHRLGAKYLPGATLYVTVEPCLMCCGALYWGKLGRIVYGAADEKNGYRRFIFPSRETAVGSGKEMAAIGKETAPFPPKTIITKGVLEEECALLMKTFFKAKR